jgi:hypothetical protein
VSFLLLLPLLAVLGVLFAEISRWEKVKSFKRKEEVKVTGGFNVGRTGTVFGWCARDVVVEFHNLGGLGFVSPYDVERTEPERGDHDVATFFSHHEQGG